MGVLRLSARAALVSLLLAAPADAQYFGRNKVEYANFDFRILTTAHFDVYYYAGEERAARLAAQLAERWYARISAVLKHEFDRRQPLVLYGSQAEFAQTNVVSGLLSDSIGGVTEGSRRRIVMPFAPTMAETDRVLGHEIVHAFQFDISRRFGGAMSQPLWFIEGMAEYLARGAMDAESSLWARDAVLNRRIPARQRDAAQHLSPYQYGYAFWAWLGQRFGDEVVEKSLKPPKKQRKTADRMRYATGVDLDTLHADWRASLRRAHGPAREPAAPAAPAIAGRMQMGPAISPDGRQAVFFSEKDRLSLDLFLADLDSGRVLRKLATTTATARFDSLQPLRSAGAWSPDGGRFVFPAVRQGRATLVLIDMRGAGGDREIVLEDLGQILSAAWSPDGRTLALSALTGGFTDLHLYDLETGTRRRLTNDAFADLQPAWSHDGRTIAFVTERHTSSLGTLRFGRTQLAVLDVAAQSIAPIGHGAGSRQSSPQWSADDRALYFVGDADGIPNVFRLDRDSSALHRVTDVGTGVSGVTPTSPALSVAGGADVLAYTVYDDGRPQLVVLDLRAGNREPGAGNQLVSHSEPSDRPASNVDGEEPGLVDRLLADDRIGVPEPATIASRDYAPRLSLEGISPPYVSAGGGPFGTFVRAGGAMMFGDMLSERRLGAAVQIGNRLRDAAFAFRFLNQERRWNWGAIAELEPGLGRYRRAEAIEHDGQAAVLKQTDYLQRMQLRAAGLVAYPFNRGLRMELTGGVRHASYHRDVRSQISSAATGRILATNRVEFSGGEPTTVAEFGAALVHDTSVFGPTGPLLGSRYRLEVAPAVGELTYTRVIADYRRYFMPVRPYSVALRLLHAGRYGPDGDDPRLMSSFLGSSYLVRGHQLDQRLCRPDATRACGDELLGSRLMVANLEVRFPIWGMLSRQLEYGPLPADAFVFLDGGLVSSSTRRANSITSLGGGIRVNAGGLPLEVAAMRALDGPAPRWQFDFGFRVGF